MRYAWGGFKKQLVANAIGPVALLASSVDNILNISKSVSVIVSTAVRDGGGTPGSHSKSESIVTCAAKNF